MFFAFGLVELTANTQLERTMLPTPLHAAIVHFPMALVVLLPITIAVALYTIRRGASPFRAWAIPIAMAGALTASAFFAQQTGEADEERVEAVVNEQAMHAHEAAAQRFMFASVLLLMVTAGGLSHGGLGKGFRAVAGLGALGVLALGVQVGHAGGELVYRHGAASAYTQDGAAQIEQNGERVDAGRRETHDDGDD
jgi:uncharacterized membrane protein